MDEAAAVRLCEDAAPGSVSDIGGYEAVKEPDGTWTVEPDDALEDASGTKGVRSAELPGWWCCLNASHWPRPPG